MGALLIQKEFRFFLLLVGAIISVSLSLSHQACAASKGNSAPKASSEFLEKKLQREGFSSGFIKEVLKNYETKDFREVLELNVLLYLRKSDYHGTQVTGEAEKAVGEFQLRNSKVFERAEKFYGVSPAVISSLLWIETRHGKNVGRFHVPSVYLHLIQGPRRVVQNYLLSKTDRFAETTTPEDHREIVRRTKVKSTWALDELRAIEKVYQRKWSIGHRFRGSFSGAFGMPQFLPSSYVKWATASASGSQRQPDLNKPADAILSVANYLKGHGWQLPSPGLDGKISGPEADNRFEALMKYNNSRDYANAILQLAESSRSLEKPIEKPGPSVSGDATAPSTSRNPSTVGNP